MAAAIRLYLDENINLVVAEQLRIKGIDALSVRDMGSLGKSDDYHFKRANELGRVFVTADTDFLKMVSGGVEHTGIVFGDEQALNVGDWVKGLELICFVYTPEDMKNHIEYL